MKQIEKNQQFFSSSDVSRKSESGQFSTNLTGSKLKILEVVHNFPPFSFAGTELYTLNLSKELQKLGHEVTILYPTILKDKEPHCFEPSVYKGLNVVQFNVYDKNAPTRSDFYNTAYDEPFQNYLSSQDFDLVHFQHFYGLSANWISIAKSLGLAVFLKIDDMFLYCQQIHLMENGKTCCSGPESIDKCLQCMFPAKEFAPPEEIAKVYQYLAFRRAYLKKIFQKIDFVHSPSHFLKNTCIQNGFINEEFHVIPTGISPFEVKQKKKSSDKEGKICVGFLGHIDERKRITDFLKAIEIYQTKLQISNQPSNLNFLIYGKHYNDEFYQELLSSLKQLKDTKYQGSFEPEDRPNIFSEINILILPSIGENYPFILREALYAQIPVIATEIAGVPEIVDDKKNGFLYPPGDVEALASILIKVSKKTNLVQQLDTGAKDIKIIETEAKELETEFNRILSQKFSNKKLNSAIISKPNSVDGSKEKAQIESLFSQGCSLVQDGKLIDGLKVLTRVLDFEPKHFHTIHLMGDIYNKLHRKEEAIRLWKLALSIQPDNLRLLKRLGRPVECSIIIPVFNQIQFTKNCIRSIEAHAPQGCYEIIVVDNHSTDETEKVLSKLRNIKVIRNKRNLGFAKACNQGAKAAAHEFILFLNNDTEVLEGWLEPLILTLLADLQVAVVGSKLLYPNGRIQHAGVITVEDKENNKPIDPWHVYHRLDGNLPQANIPREYPAVTGACLMTRRSVFETLNGFDAVFRNGFEDVDYCYKVGAAGYKIVYQPTSVAIHYESQSGSERFSHNLENFNILVAGWKDKVPVDVIRWGNGKHDIIRPFKNYKSQRLFCNLNRTGG